MSSIEYLLWLFLFNLIFSLLFYMRKNLEHSFMTKTKKNKFDKEVQVSPETRKDYPSSLSSVSREKDSDIYFF